VPSRKDNIDIIRGMALSAAAAVAKGEAVRTELEEDFANEQLKIRVSIGKRSAVFGSTTRTWSASRATERSPGRWSG